MDTSVFVAVALAIPTGLGAIALVIRLADWLADLINEHLESKKTYIIPDGNGGYIQLPPGMRYEPIAPITKEDK